MPNDARSSVFTCDDAFAVAHDFHGVALGVGHVDAQQLLIG